MHLGFGFWVWCGNESCRRELWVCWDGIRVFYGLIRLRFDRGSEEFLMVKGRGVSPNVKSLLNCLLLICLCFSGGGISSDGSGEVMDFITDKSVTHGLLKKLKTEAMAEEKQIIA